MKGPLTRRDLLLLVSGGMTAGVAGCQELTDRTPTTHGRSPSSGGGHTPTTTSPGPDTIGLETIVSDLQAPTDVAFLPNDDRIYVATKPGRIHVIGSDGTSPIPLLDIRNQVKGGYEMGLLGIALHPSFEETNRLYVRYSSPPRDGTPEDYNHTFVLAEFEVGEDGMQADPESERAVLEIPQPHANHNSGSIVFGPDNYLYVGTGDGGGVGDTGPGHTQDWYGGNDGGNGQDTSANLLGGILRIDVDGRTGDRGYGIPDDNPLVDDPDHLDEYYAWGLRNPWGASFDGDRFFVGDVGQARWEEVNLVHKGGNYGWNVKEGSRCFDASDRMNSPEECPEETPPDVRGGEPLIDPIIEYPHWDREESPISGAAVVGGYIYRGGAIPALDGRYVFGDLQPEGRLFLGTPPDGGTTEWSIRAINLTTDAADTLGRILGFGRDDDGEVYVLGGGGVHKLVEAE